MASATGKSIFRDRLVLGLRVLGLTCSALAMLSLVLIHISGTWMVGTGEDGRRSIALSKLSVITFDGIVPSHDPSRPYLVHMHWFLNAFGWEYPTAPTPALTAGFLSRAPGTAVSVPADLVSIARTLSLPVDEYQCLVWPGRLAPDCSNTFFEAFNRRWYRITEIFSNKLPFVVISYLLFLYAYTFATEIMIAHKPAWMYCRCCWLRGLCPSPKKGDCVTRSTWHKYRWVMYGALCVTHAETALLLVLKAKWLLLKLDAHTQFRMDGMNLRLGTGFQIVNWGGAIASFVAVLCYHIIMCVERRRPGWAMEAFDAADGVEACDGEGACLYEKASLLLRTGKEEEEEEEEDTIEEPYTDLESVGPETSTTTQIEERKAEVDLLL